MPAERRDRKKNRLEDYDYSQDGYYFVTICTKNMVERFGEIRDDKMILSPIGEIVDQCWQAIPEHFPNVELDEYVVMPNHVHGVIVIENNNDVGVQNFEPLHDKINKFQHIIPRSLGSIIRGFKIGVTKYCRNNNCGNVVWQRNFYDHIIRNERSLTRIREYIHNNPSQWASDRNNPDNID